MWAETLQIGADIDRSPWRTKAIYYYKVDWALSNPEIYRWVDGFIRDCQLGYLSSAIAQPIMSDVIYLSGPRIPLQTMWRSFGAVKGETEPLIMPSQGGRLGTVFNLQTAGSTTVAAVRHVTAFGASSVFSWRNFAWRVYTSVACVHSNSLDVKYSNISDYENPLQWVRAMFFSS